ncbi:hypothetical protein EDD37DRAFT_460523 [Exophiala viscosa]|uniref:uncharacterized protein n=1 Tax=Exophiala viscosa TaxID=2486360 RepID=UPI0021A0A53C|nr:hypothetical protein EDD37DRAFT_460523 [Exophiala viscosa]
MTSREEPEGDALLRLHGTSAGQYVHGSHGFERQPWQNWREQLGSEIQDDEDDKFSTNEVEEDRNTVQDFMRSPEQSPVNIPEADVVEEYCDIKDLKLLRTGISCDEKINTWLDETQSGSRRAMSRKSRWLTPYQLYQESLRIPPVKAPKTGTGMGQAPSEKIPGRGFTTSTSEDYQGKQIIRQLIYIHDPDHWNVFALILTATYYRTAGLRLALYRHFSSRTSLDVLSSSYGYPNFQLVFSLPYWAWRSSTQPVQDHRQNKHKEPLRDYWDVSLLEPGQHSERSFIYEAQITCVVTGLVNECTWSVYCFDDNRHDGKNAQNARQHSSDVTDGIHTDPISFGVIDANNPIQEPYAYFIRILAIRAKLVRDEWRKITRKIALSIRRYDREHFPLSQAQAYWVLQGEVGSPQQTMVDSLKLVMVIKNTSTRLLDTLTKTIDAYDGFQIMSVPAFLDVPDANHQNRLLYDLPATYRDLRDLKNELEALSKRAEEFARELESRLAFETNQTSGLQRELTETGNRLARASNELATCNGASAAIMLLYFSPIALGAGVFSMDENVIGFLPRTFGSFLVLVLGFGIFGFVIFYYWPYLSGILQRCLAPTKSLHHGNIARLKAIFVERFHLLCRPTVQWRRSLEEMYAELLRFSRRHPRYASRQSAGDGISLPSWSGHTDRQPSHDQPRDAETQS